MIKSAVIQTAKNTIIPSQYYYGYWSGMNEAAAAVELLDQSGNSNDCVRQAGISQAQMNATKGMFTSVASTTGGINLPSNSGLTLTDAMIFSTRFKTANVAAGTITIFGSLRNQTVSGTEKGYLLHVDAATGTAKIVMSAISPDYHMGNSLRGAIALVNNTWATIGMLIDNYNRVVSLYVNGVLDKTLSLSGWTVGAFVADNSVLDEPAFSYRNDQASVVSNFKNAHCLIVPGALLGDVDVIMHKLHFNPDRMLTDTDVTT